jgi:hypothetical protein
LLICLTHSLLVLPAGVARASSKFDFAAHGLPEPRSATVDGLKGYNALLSQLRSNPRASWGASWLLRGEREFRARGGVVKRYLTTGWVWFENGSALWPDPYLINCNNNASGYRSEASFYCGSTNIQIAGYRAYTRRNDYVRMYRVFWSDDKAGAVLRWALDRGPNASRSAWDYKYSGQQKGLVTEYAPQLGGVTLGDISPNRSVLSWRGQFFTYLLGKHPYMAVALNSFAVSDGDLVYQLRTRSCAYGYICAREQRLLSNMVAALIIFETGSL